jgi:hypothetical protein
MTSMQMLAALWLRAETCPDAAQIIRAVIADHQRRQVFSAQNPAKAMRALP